MRVHRHRPTVSQPASSRPRASAPKASGAPAASADVFEAPAPAPRTSGPTLREGASGSDVVRMQRLLAQAGFDPGSADGDFGPRTAAALVAFQEDAGLDADGICGPMTWGALQNGVVEIPEVVETPEVSGPDGELRGRILALAQAEVGTMEETGNNDGPVLKYPNAFGRGSEPYCADFVSWVSTRAGRPLDYAYVPYLRDHLEETGRWKGASNPQPGDIVIFDFDGSGDGDHVGFVKAVLEDGTIETIEGNTSPDDRLSDSATLESGVWNRVRSMNDILGFGTP